MYREETVGPHRSLAPLFAALLVVLSFAISLSLTTLSAAQDYPSRPIRAYTTSSAGGLSDVFMRALGEELRIRLGQPIIVENRPGASQNLGSRACAEAAPDGYTICIINADPVVYNQFLFKHIGFDPEKGLQPVTNLFHLIQVLVVNAKLKVKSVDELIALSQKQAGTLSYLTAAVPLALYMEKLREEKGADWVRVPFKGGGEAVNAVLQGSTPIALIGLGNVMPQIDAGELTPLVMANNIRTPRYPDVPTLRDTGYLGAPSQGWYGLFVPAGTPKAIVDRLVREIADIYKNQTFVERNLISRGLVPAVNSPEEFTAQIVKDRATAEQVVKDAKLEMR
jgi:tripartite-type tricarboxylate transporter receptor subunit TctC